MADVVLIAEDDENIVELLRLYLSGSGYEVRCAHDGAEALEILRTEPVSIALVDLMMPKLNGYDLIRQARGFTNVPIVIVSARTQAVDKIVGLDAGADGYITKPFDPLEVTAYIRAMLRRAGRVDAAGAQEDRRADVVAADASAGQGAAPAGAGGAAPAHRAFAPTRQGEGAPAAGPHSGESPAPAGGAGGSGARLVVGDLAFDTERLLLRKDGETVPLTAAELKIVRALMQAPGRVFTKAQLYEVATGEACIGGESSVMVHISNIRAKLDDPDRPSHIATVRGLGYRLDAQGAA